MENRNYREGKECNKPECQYNQPYMRRHTHMYTNDGEIVRYIVDKPIVRDIGD